MIAILRKSARAAARLRDLITAQVYQQSMHLIQLLLPLHDNEGRPFSVSYFAEIRHDLTERFGGVTAFVRAPADGLWKESAGDLSRDELVMFEVLAAQLDKDWWASYRKGLQQKFRQDEVLIWASVITKL